MVVATSSGMAYSDVLVNVNVINSSIGLAC